MINMCRISIVISYFLVILLIKPMVQEESGSSGFGCTINCALTKASNFIKMFSLLNQPFSTTVAESVTVANAPYEFNVINKSCSILEDFADCVNKCPVDKFQHGVATNLAGLQQMCKDNVTESTKEAEECLNTYGKSIHDMCKHSYENLLAAGVRFQDITQFKNPADLVNSTKILCRDTMVYAQCVIPALSQKCNGTVLDMFNHVISMVNGTVQSLIGQTLEAVPTCAKLLKSKIFKGEKGIMTFGQPPANGEMGTVTPSSTAMTATTTRRDLIEIHTVTVTTGHEYKKDGQPDGRKLDVLDGKITTAAAKKNGATSSFLTHAYFLITVITVVHYVAVL